MVFANCNCHIKGCPVCGQCPKHDCTHDGISLSAKASRKRGRQPGKLKRITPNKRQAAMNVNYREGSMQELLHRSISDCMGSQAVKACKKVSEIGKVLELGESYISHFPSLETRKKETNLRSIDRHTAMVQFTTRAFQKICEIVYPGNPSALQEAVLKKETSDEESLKENIARVAVSLPRQSVERRSLFAILAGNTKRKELSELTKATSSGKFVTNSEAYTFMVRDYEALRETQQLKAETRSCARYDRSVVEKAVRFILSPQNAQILSWGEMKTMVGSKEVCLPKVTRKKIAKYIWNDYEELTKHDEARVGRSSMMEIIGAITANDMKAVTAVDYATGILVNDNCDRIKSLIDTVGNDETQKSLDAKLSELTAIIKRHLDTAALASDANEFDSHSFRFGLDVSACQERSNKKSCRKCQRVFEIMNELRDALDITTHEFLADAELKFRLYMGHR